MSNITRCTACGGLYEESSWEAANDPRPEMRQCPPCFKVWKKHRPDQALERLGRRAPLRQCHCGEPLDDPHGTICDPCWNIEKHSGYESPRKEE